MPCPDARRAAVRRRRLHQAALLRTSRRRRGAQVPPTQRCWRRERSGQAQGKPKGKNSSSVQRICAGGSGSTGSVCRESVTDEAQPWQAKRLHTCVAPGCKRRPSFGQAHAPATRCSRHRIPGDIDVINVKCRAPACQRGAIFGGPDTSWHRAFCKRHCEPSHVNLAYLRARNLTAAALRNQSLLETQPLARLMSRCRKRALK